jgi:HAD superfamily hydrolase (TIGR01509 family)
MTHDGDIELVLFDFGGTLFMPAPTPGLLRAAALTLGLDLDKPTLASLAGAYDVAGIPGGPVGPIPPMLQDCYDRRDLGPAEHRAAWVAMLLRAELPAGAPVPDPTALAEAVYEQTLHPDQWVPYPDAAPTLAALAERDVRVGLISNIGFDLREVLHWHGFGALADSATLSFEVGAVKPDPKLFRAALKTFGVAPAMAVMIGDNEVADGGAAALGITTLILPMTDPGTVHELARVTELVDRLNLAQRPTTG